MKTRRALCAVAFAFALAGCNSVAEQAYVAKAVDAPTPAPVALSPREKLDQRIARYAAAYDIPESLIHSAVRRESNYNPAAKHGPYWGLMQIRYDTARSLGYEGPAKGLLDADTNLAYAGAYLANAYKVAEGDEKRAIKLYAKGFYYEAKRKGLLEELRKGEAAKEPATTVEKSEPAPAAVAQAQPEK